MLPNWLMLNRSRELHEKTKIVMRTIKLREQTQSYITHWLDQQTTQPHHCTGTYLWSLSKLRNHNSWILWPQTVKQCIHHRIKNWVACKNRKEKWQILKKIQIFPMVDKYKKEMGQIIHRCKINSNKITKSAETYISNNFYSSQITKKK